MEYVKDLNEISQIIQEKPLSLLYISQPQCSVCHSVLPKVEKLAEEIPHLTAIHADASQTPALAGAFMIFTVPVVIIFSYGKEVYRQARFIQMDELENKLIQMKSLAQKDLSD
ncbi:MAG: thioredoxin family protein [Bacillaceae bacterium]|nr:thioredoxin family protein [Bacillaceae bacterium]